MSIITQAIVVEKYGFRADVDALAKILGMSKGSVRNRISEGKLPIVTYVDGGKRWADYRDIAEYIDRCRPKSGATIPA